MTTSNVDSRLHPLIKRPMEMCAEVEQQMPHVLRFIERQRQARAQKQKWERWAYAPFSLVWDIVDEYTQHKVKAFAAQIAQKKETLATMLPAFGRDIEQLAIGYLLNEGFTAAIHALALSAWRMSGKHVFVLHEDVLDSLLESHSTEETLPSSILSQLPYWSGYIIIDRRVPLQMTDDESVSDKWINLRGVLFALLWFESKQSNCGVCSIHLDCVDECGNPLYAGFPLFMDEERPLKTLIEESTLLDSQISLQNAHEVDKPNMAPLFARALQPLLYLCASNAEARLATPSEQAAPPRPNRAQREKLFAPQHETIWAVGYRIGAAIKAAREATQRAEKNSLPTGRTVRPHIRRAHWHGYRVGPNRSGWKLIWLPPIAVNIPERTSIESWLDNLPTTQRQIGITS